MARSFRGNHGDVNEWRRLNGAEADVEAVGEHQCLARFEIRLDGVAVKLRLLGIGSKNHDDIGPGSDFGGSADGEAVFFRLCARSTAWRKAHTDGHATVAKIERAGVSLRTIADDSDFFLLNNPQIH